MEQTAKEVVLTYELLYELLRKEKSREDLQELDENFFSDSLNYLREKQQAYDENLAKNDIFSQSERDKLHIQIANIKKIFKDLYDFRERKIINMAINSSRTNSNIVDTTQLLIQEKTLYNNLNELLTKYRTGILHRLLEQRELDVLPSVMPAPEITPTEKPEAPSESSNTKKVKFVESVEQFAGKELELYGPFEPEQEAILPPELAEILISQGKAVEI